MFFKQYNYKPRTNSQSSGSDRSAAGSPPKEDVKMPADTSTTAAAAAAGRRRSSAGEQFGGLSAVKRGGQDQDRKASWAEQKPGGSGILGGMWTSFTKGK